MLIGHADDAQERDVKDVGLGIGSNWPESTLYLCVEHLLDDRDPRQATLQIMDNDAKTKNCESRYAMISAL